MPPSKDDKVRKDRKEKSRRRGSTGTELVSDSELGTPLRGARGSDALMDLQDTPQAEQYSTQEHGGRDSAKGQATVVPPNSPNPPLEVQRRSQNLRTEVDNVPITKADLASMQTGLALMLQNALAEGVQSIKLLQERQNARFSALEEANRSLAEKVKLLETSTHSRAASVPLTRNATGRATGPQHSHSGDTSMVGARRAASEHPRGMGDTQDTMERKNKQCILSGFKDRLSLAEFKALVPTLTDKNGKVLETPSSVTFTTLELFSDKSRLEFPTEWDRRAYASAFITGQPKHKGLPIYCNRVLDKQTAWRSWMVREARRFICSKDASFGPKLRICPRSHILYSDRQVAFFIGRDEKPQKDVGWPPGIPFEEFLAGEGRLRG
eukprot:1956640-Amphidinium_carterae.2